MAFWNVTKCYGYKRAGEKVIHIATLPGIPPSLPRSPVIDACLVLSCMVVLLLTLSTVQVIGVEQAMERVRELKKLGPPKPVKGERARSKRRVPVVAIIGESDLRCEVVSRDRCFFYIYIA